MIDTSALPVVDVHCHPFLNRGAVDPEQFTDMLAFGGGSPAYMEQGGVKVDDDLRGELQRVKRDVLYFRYMLHRLAEYFAVETDLEIIVDERNKAVEADYTAYVKGLYDYAGITTLVVDFGIPLPIIPIADFTGEVQTETVPVYRIEPLIADLLKEEIFWDEFKRRFDEALAHAIEHEGYKGFKSIIAYRTGLDISPLSRNVDQGMKAHEAIRRGIGGEAMKKLRDYLFCRTLEICMDYDIPMQVHTGMGDFEVNLVACRPALLMDLLRFPTFRACKVLLVHTGYPYHREAGYMANVLPRVYCDVSEGIPFAAHAARRIFSEVMELAPVSKIVYGSDGFSGPELNFAGALLGKQALGQALQDVVDDSFITSAEAEVVARQVLSDNARKLYELDE